MKRYATAFSVAILSCTALISPATSQNASDTTGITNDTIKIGVFGPLTGAAASFGKAELGMMAYYKDVSEHGGINGRKIEVVQEDTACDVAKGIAAVKKLVSQDQVFILHGGSCSNVVLAVEPQIIAVGLPYVVGSAASAQIAVPVHPTVFQPVPNTTIVSQAMVDFAMSRPKAAKIAIVSHSDEWGKSNHDPAVAYLKDKYHLAPSSDMTMERGSTDATPQILRLRQDKPDFILAILYPAELAIFERDAYKYGLTTPVVANQSITIEDTRSRVGTPAAVNNLYVFYPMAAPVNDPSMVKWSDLNKHYYPDVRVDSSSLLGLGGAVTVVEALKRAGRDLTRQKFIEAMNGIHDFDTGVLGAPMSFSPTNHAGVQGGSFLHYDGDKLETLHAFSGGKS
jgi:branched-chain amino acid transport system substrate-binding protein